MKNVIRSVSGLAACVLGVLFSASCDAGFDLKLDNVRTTGVGAYALDVILVVTPSPSAVQTFEFITYNLEIAPANGYTLSSITGVRFDDPFKPSNPGTALFNNPDLFGSVATLKMTGAVQASGPVAAPSQDKVVFSVRFSTTSSSPSDIEIKFVSEAANDNKFIESFENDGEQFRTFDNLFASPPITVVGVPEPGTCLLSALAMAGVVALRRKKSWSAEA